MKCNLGFCYSAINFVFTDKFLPIDGLNLMTTEYVTFISLMFFSAAFRDVFFSEWACVW